MNINKLLSKSIDLHVHVGPEIIPRKYNLQKLQREESNKLFKVAVKNHFFATTSMLNNTTLADSNFIIHSVVLNRYVGGFNPNIVEAVAELANNIIIVWFPTIHAKQILSRQEYEIPLEWFGSSKNMRRLKHVKNVSGLSVFGNNGKLLPAVKEVLKSIKRNNAILATGHLSYKETLSLVKYGANTLDLKKIIITHPIYRRINMPIHIQKELVNMGAVIEHCYSMYSIDKIPIGEIASQIKEVGASNCILSSDVGQRFGKSPSEALKDFVRLLQKEGISESDIRTMLITNPRKLLEE